MRRGMEERDGGERRGMKRDGEERRGEKEEVKAVRN